MAWNYWWGYTSAQIELLASDCPIVVYPDEKGGKPSTSSIREAEEKWKSKYGDGKKVDISNIVNKIKWQN